MSTMVYHFGLLRPTVNKALVEEQMLLAHRYRNTLIEIERGRRAAVRLAMGGYADIQALEAEANRANEDVEGILTKIRLHRSEERSRSEGVELKDALKASKITAKEARRMLFERRAELRKDVALVAEIDRINDLALVLHKSAREQCGVYWGTYLLVEDAMKAAAKMPIYDGIFPNDPHFIRWDGDAQIGVQIQAQQDKAAFCTQDLFGNDTRIRIDPVDEKAWYSETRGIRRKASRTMLHIRVGSSGSGGKEPVWASFPMIMHRPIPKDATIKRARVGVRNFGPHQEWTVDITVDTVGEPKKVCGPGTVAIDVGWRKIEDEVRVCRWVADDDKFGELRLDEDLLSGFKKVVDLASIRDKSFNLAKTKLIEWMKDNEVPEWVTKTLSHLHAWRSIERLRNFISRWTKERFAGDEDAYEHLKAWCDNDVHLWAWEENQRIKSLRRRRETYRIFAVELTKRYGTVVLEDFDLRPIQKRPKTGSPDDQRQNETARGNRHLVAIGEFRSALDLCFRSRGGRTVTVPAQFTTLDCADCGHTNSFNASTDIVQACESCGLIFDQDDNAAKNILKSWFDVEKTQKEEAPKEIKEKRWVKARRLAMEKSIRTKKSGNGSGEGTPGTKE